MTTPYTTQPGYQPVATNDFHQPPPPAYTPNNQPAPPYHHPTQAYPQYPPHPHQHPGYVQQQSTNNVVVVQASTNVIPVIARPAGYVADAGQSALVFSMIITIFAFIFGCWWIVFCSIPAMIFASSASSAGLRGDANGVRSNNNLSYGCTFAAIVSGVVGIGVICGVVFGIAYSPSSRHYPYYK